MMKPAFVALVLLGFTARASARAVNFRGSGQVPSSVVGEILTEEIADKDHHLSKFEDGLRQMYVSLPKNWYGNLDHQTVCYALHRFFVDKYGWYINGLDSSAARNASELSNVIQDKFEMQHGRWGINLHGLATLAASLVDLAGKESQVRLKDAYMANDVSFEGPANHHDAIEVLETFLISFLVSNNWTVNDRLDLKVGKEIFHTQYKGHDGTMAWYEPIRNRHLGKDEARKVPFDDVAKATMEIGQTYHSFNNLDCKSLKATLTSMEGKTPGRVRLSTFYNASLYTHWAFTEKADFLRALGALDESDPKQTSVIIPNYALARLNCLNATRVYAICCRNTCDDLTSHLERDIGAPSATVERIIELVSALPSESVTAPRMLPDTLVGRLQEVSAHHGGQVPLHGRLFAQWMHHAYPLECPYPQANKAASVQTAEEWTARTGEETEASPDVMKQVLEADTCARDVEGNVGCSEESTELPWSMSEELIALHVVEQSSRFSICPLFALLCLLAAAALIRPFTPCSISGCRLESTIGRSAGQQNYMVLISLLLSASAYFINLLDGVVFGIALASSSAFMGARLVSRRFGAKSGKDCGFLLPRQVKTV